MSRGGWRTRKFDDWTILESDNMKSYTGYVGLKNLGCTCYMNSFFQQIYMIDSFKNAISNCEILDYKEDE
jgi:ubiquitin carboxyl-terminal hydrolase 9/24